MPHKPKTDFKGARARRTKALQRDELRGPTSERVPSSGAVSMAVKVVDPDTRALIDAALAARTGA